MNISPYNSGFILVVNLEQQVVEILPLELETQEADYNWAGFSFVVVKFSFNLENSNERRY